jgi:hypothetical protein
MDKRRLMMRSCLARAAAKTHFPSSSTDRTCRTSSMVSLRIIALVAAGVFCTAVQGLDVASSSSASSSCSDAHLQQLNTLVADIRLSLESDAHSGSGSSSVPASCKAALAFDLSAASAEDEDEASCVSDCIAWIEDVVDAPTCGDQEMLMYQRRMAAYLTQCSNERKTVRLQETDALERNSRLRGLAAGMPEERKLGVKGLMDALLVVTLNNAL